MRGVGPVARCHEESSRVEADHAHSVETWGIRHAIAGTGSDAARGGGEAAHAAALRGIVPTYEGSGCGTVYADGRQPRPRARAGGAVGAPVEPLGALGVSGRVGGAAGMPGIRQPCAAVHHHLLARLQHRGVVATGGAIAAISTGAGGGAERRHGSVAQQLLPAAVLSASGRGSQTVSGTFRADLLSQAGAARGAFPRLPRAVADHRVERRPGGRAAERRRRATVVCTSARAAGGVFPALRLRSGPGRRWRTRVALAGACVCDFRQTLSPASGRVAALRHRLGAGAGAVARTRTDAVRDIPAAGALSFGMGESTADAVLRPTPADASATVSRAEPVAGQNEQCPAHERARQRGHRWRQRQLRPPAQFAAGTAAGTPAVPGGVKRPTTHASIETALVQRPVAPRPTPSR
eukprot:ctg_334.g181